MNRLTMLIVGAAAMSLMAPVFAKKGAAEGSDPTKTETAPETENTAATTATAATDRKSIVPGGWKPKNDELKQFIDNQCTGKDGFQWPAFFELMRKNGIPAEQVDKYEQQVAAKQHGAPGRAKMTLRNMLATIVRKNGEAVGLDDAKTAINLPKPAVSGAAAKAQEGAANADTESQKAA